MPVAQAVAHRYRGRGVDTDELEQLAYVGLTCAAQRYDVRRDHDFLSFAVPWMTGTIRRHFRDHTWAIRPIRRVQELHQRLNRLEGRADHTLDVHEAAALLDVTPDEVHEARHARALQRLKSLDEPALSGRRLADLIPGRDPEELRNVEVSAVLGPLLATLTARDGYVLRRLYVDEWTQAEVGAELGLTQMAISRIHSRALAAMRAQLSDAA